MPFSCFNPFDTTSFFNSHHSSILLYWFETAQIEAIIFGKKKTTTSPVTCPKHSRFATGLIGLFRDQMLITRRQTISHFDGFSWFPVSFSKLSPVFLQLVGLCNLSWVVDVFGVFWRLKRVLSIMDCCLNFRVSIVLKSHFKQWSKDLTIFSTF